MARSSYPSVAREPPQWRLPNVLDITSVQDVVAFLRMLLIVLVDQIDYIRRATIVLRGVLDGKTNNVGDITLTASSTTTTLTDPLITVNSCIVFMPTTANAGAALQDGAFYVTIAAHGSATLTHTSNSNDDKSFTYVVVG
jgi:hypothetical protein